MKEQGRKEAGGSNMDILPATEDFGVTGLLSPFIDRRVMQDVILPLVLFNYLIFQMSELEVELDKIQFVVQQKQLENDDLVFRLQETKQNAEQQQSLFQQQISSWTAELQDTKLAADERLKELETQRDALLAEQKDAENRSEGKRKELEQAISEQEKQYVL